MKQDKLPTARSGNNPLFWTLTGRDFTDAIRMARTEPNLVREAIQRELEKLKKK